MTTQPPPESAEPAPAATDTQARLHVTTNENIMADDFARAFSCCGGNDETPQGHCVDCPEHPSCPGCGNEVCECVATPAPAGDAEVSQCPGCTSGRAEQCELRDGHAEVSHEQARQALIELVDVEKVEHVSTLQRFLMQCEARQQQAERDAAEGLRLVKELRASAQQAEQRIAEYKASEADWRESPRAAQSVLQGKDEAIAELRAELENAREARSADAAEGAERLAELSRKLEAAEREVEQMRAPTYIRCGKHSGHDMGHDFSGAVETSDPVAPIQECAPPDQPPPAKPLTPDDDPLLAAEQYVLATGPDEPGSGEALRNAVMSLIDAIRERTDMPSSVGLVTRDDVRSIALAVVAEVATRAADIAPDSCSSYAIETLDLLAEAAKEERDG